MFNLGQTRGKVTLFMAYANILLKNAHLVLLCAQNARNVQVFRTSVLNFTGLFKALESSDIFAQNVEFDIHYRSHFDVAEVGILSGIRNDGNGKCVVCRITYGERNAVNGNAALVHREIAFSCHFLIELIFESK